MGTDNDIGSTRSGTRWTAVSFRLWPNDALQLLANAHYDVGSTYYQCLCFGWVIVGRGSFRSFVSVAAISETLKQWFTENFVQIVSHIGLGLA